MPTSFREYNDDAAMLLPLDMRDWLPEDHLAYQIRDLVHNLDMTPFYRPYAGDGRRNRPYDPTMMMTVLIYAYATGVFSSRRIARKLHEDVAFRLLCGSTFPSHRTLCEFRRRHLGDFEHLFVAVVQLAQEAGIVRLGTVTVDGTKVRANASRHKAMSYARMREEEARLKAEIAALLARAGEVDAAEDTALGADSEDVPKEIARRESRLEAIREARARLEARQRTADAASGREPGADRSPKGGSPYKRPYGEPEAKAQENFTDPESRIMKTSTEGFQQCYNAQVVVDADHQMIVATEVGQQANDQGQLNAMLDRVEATAGAAPDAVLADAGYCSEEAFTALEKRGIEGHVALGREGRKQAGVDPVRHPATRRMAERLARPEGRAHYARRKWIAEAPHGWIKQAMGFRRFSVRGLEQARGEWRLVCLALNARRLVAAVAS